MDSPDFEVIKEIPGYKIILKAVLKSQIQQLIDQLAAHTEEESIILTASVADGILSNLGSDSGKSFLDNHEDVKSQFLGFCLKAHHQKAQQGKLERQEAAQQGTLEQQEVTQQEKLERRKAIPPSFAFYTGPPKFPCTVKSPRLMSPRPVLMIRGPHIGQIWSSSVRHEPYPGIITQNTASNFDQQCPGDKLQDEQIIKVEPCSDDETSNQSDLNITAQNVHRSSQPSSPSEASAALSQMKNVSLDEDDVALLKSSISIISSESQSEGSSLDSDLSNLIKAHHQKAQQGKLQQQEDAQQRKLEQQEAAQQGTLERQEVAQQEKLERRKAIPPFFGYYSGPPRFPCMAKSPRLMSPRPILMIRGPYIGQIRSSSVRHEPYPGIITQNRALNFDKRSSGDIIHDGQVIKVEHISDDKTSNQSDLNIITQIVHNSSQPSFPLEAAITSSQIKNVSLDEDDVALLESSISIVPSESQPEGPCLDLDLPNLIKSEECSQTSSSGDVDTYMNIEAQSISDLNMDLNIMGVEHCKEMVSYADWTPNDSMAMNFNSSRVMNYDSSYAALDQPKIHATPHGYMKAERNGVPKQPTFFNEDGTHSDKTMAMTSSERQRRYRQNRDQDPKKRELYLQKEREKYQKYKTIGKTKLVKDMTEKERRFARDRWRTLKRKSREKEAVRFPKPPVSSKQLNKLDKVTKTLKLEWIQTD